MQNIPNFGGELKLRDRRRGLCDDINPLRHLLAAINTFLDLLPLAIVDRNPQSPEMEHQQNPDLELIG